MIEDALNELAKSQTQQLDAYLRWAADVLGLTPEELAKQYILEHHAEDATIADGESYVLQLHQRYRLVRKDRHEPADVHPV